MRISADQVARTNDIASFERLSLALEDDVDPTLAKVLADLDFEALPTLDGRHVWRWRQTRQQTLVEFLPPSFQEDEDLRDLPAFGVSAQPLHFLNYLIAEPVTVPLPYRDGALIQIPRPERYAVHKLIVSVRRRKGEDSEKANKDRAQAQFLIRILSQEDPYALAKAWQSAREKGPA